MVVAPGKKERSKFSWLRKSRKESLDICIT